MRPSRDYAGWQARLRAWLADQLPAPLAEPSSDDPLAARLLEIMAWARLVVAGLGATASGARVEDRNKYKYMAQRLADILPGRNRL